MEKLRAAIYYRVEGPVYTDPDMAAFARIYQYIKSGGLYATVAAVIDSGEDTRVWEILQEEFRGGRFDVIVTTDRDGVVVAHETPEPPPWDKECAWGANSHDNHPLHVLLGHDNLGHKLYYALRRANVDTVEQLREKGNDWFLNLRNLGDKGIVRIHTVLGRNREKEKHREP